MPRKKKTEEAEEVEKADEVVEESAEEPEETEADENEESKKSIIMLPPLFDMLGGGGGRSDGKIRVLGMIGDVDEEKASELIYGMLALKESGKREDFKIPEDNSSSINDCNSQIDNKRDSYG